MIVINEWLPNPVGADSAGEWVELWNNGSERAAVQGWQIQNKSGKKTTLKGEISANGYLVIKRADSKLTLRNTDEELVLLNAQGKLIDKSGFLGSAPEGKSFSRVGENFVFLDPTPGLINRAPEALTAAVIYPIGKPLNATLGFSDFWLMLIGAAAFLTALAIFILKSNENLSQFFFKRD